MNSKPFILFQFALLFTVQLAHGETKYVGSATCASSNCHGSVSPRAGTNVLQNEYTTWYRNGAHAQAWKVLTKKESKIIGKHLGIKSPESDPLCLKCHATYIPKSAQGPRYRLSDGVGCESCHGAAEKYLKPHTARDSSHKKNVSLGLIDLVSLEKRAQVCMDCHLGTDNQTVNHRLIGAGHPRLTYELDTYGILQPNHWEVDADYVKRKSAYNSGRAWLVGQILRGSELVEVMQSEKRSKFGAMPELSNYYCYNCHHSLKEDQWKKRAYGGRPGELHLNVSSILIAAQGLRPLDKGLAEQIEQKANALSAAHVKGNDRAILAELKSLLEGKAIALVASGKFDQAVGRQMMKSVAAFASRSGTTYPYEVAEQCAMAFSALSATVDPGGKKYQKGIDAVYEALGDEEGFNPSGFRKASAVLLKQL